MNYVIIGMYEKSVQVRSLKRSNKSMSPPRRSLCLQNQTNIPKILEDFTRQCHFITYFFCAIGFS